MFKFINNLWKNISSINFKLIIFVLAATTAATVVFADETIIPTVPTTSAVSQNKSNYVNGFILNQNTFEYPQNTDMTEMGLKQELSSIISTTKKYGFNSIFFETRTPEGSFYRSEIFSGSLPMLFSSADPLNLLCEVAKENSVKIYAMVDIFSAVDDNPPFMGKLEGQTVTSKNTLLIDYNNEQALGNVNDALSEIVKNYNLEGIVLTGFDKSFENNDLNSLENIEKRLMQISKRLKTYDTGKTIGIALNSQWILNGDNKKLLYTLCKNGYIDFVMPQITITSDNASSLKAILQEWKKLSDTFEIKLFSENLANRTLSPSTDGIFFRNPNEVIYQLFFNHSLKLNGNVISSYEDIKRNRLNLGNSLYRNLKEADFAIYEDFLTMPKSSLSVFPSGEIVITDKDSYYITGTSNPKSPLFMDGKAFMRNTNNGTFGVDVQLSNGMNEFTFIQNGERISALINKTSISEPTITKMNKDTAFPLNNEVYNKNQVITLSITAPADAKISAMLGNSVYQLKQHSSKDTRNSVTYSTEFKLTDDYPSVKDMGNIIYSMSYNGVVTNCKSLGKIYVANEGVDFVARVSRFLGELYRYPDRELSPYFSLKEGCTDIIKSSVGDFYLLKSGGYIQKSDVNIQTENTSVHGTILPLNHIDNVVINTSKRGETFTLIGCENSPVFLDYNEKENEVYVYIYNTENFPVSLSHLGSELFDNINVDINKENVKLTFKLNINTILWGSDVSYSDGNTHIIFKTPPTLSNNPLLPLKNINIFVNPLFGGEMRGQASRIDSSLPDEADLNLINAYIVAIKLRSLGANVTLSRNSDISYAFDDKLRLSESISPDIVVNLSHSLASVDNENSSMGVYYTTSSSKILASRISSVLGNTFSDVSANSYFASNIKENRITYCPCVSIDIGNLSDVAQYEQLCDLFRIYKFSTSVSNGIMEYLNFSDET